MPCTVSSFTAGPPSVNCFSSPSSKDPDLGSLDLLRASKAEIAKTMCSRFAASPAAVQPTTTGTVWKNRVWSADFPDARSLARSALSPATSKLFDP